MAKRIRPSRSTKYVAHNPVTGEYACSPYGNTTSLQGASLLTEATARSRARSRELDRCTFNFSKGSAYKVPLTSEWTVLEVEIVVLRKASGSSLTPLQEAAAWLRAVSDNMRLTEQEDDDSVAGFSLESRRLLTR